MHVETSRAYQQENEQMTRCVFMFMAISFMFMAISFMACSTDDPVQRGDSGADGSLPGSDGTMLADQTIGDAPVQPTSDGGDPVQDGSVVQPDGPGPSTLWKPAPGTTWQWQLTGNLDTSVEAQMFDIDLFDNDAATIASLKSQGRVVICYFSAGSFEDWRPDAGDFPQEALGDPMSGWDELWLDIRHQGVRSVMTARLDLAKSKGCDGVEPDNVDGYANDTGFGLTDADQINYNKFLAAEAHNRGLSVALKNDLEQVAQLEPFFDFALNEECLEWDECDMLAPFINAGKAVFHVEYTPKTASTVCPQVQSLQFDTLIKHPDLDAWYEACWN
jgi:hypothetical protein